MNYLIIELDYILKNISYNKYFRKFIIRNKILSVKKRIKRNILNKNFYNASDIIEFVRLLKSAELLNFFKPDNDINYHHSDSYGNIDTALLIYNVKNYSDTQSLQISYKAKIFDQYPHTSSIDIEWGVYKKEDKPGLSNIISGVYLMYSKSVKSIDKSIDFDNDNSVDMIGSSYEILNNIFLIYIEEIFDGIEKRYL